MDSMLMIMLTLGPMIMLMIMLTATAFDCLTQ